MKFLKNFFNQWSTFKGIVLAVAVVRPELAVGVEIVDAVLNVILPAADVSAAVVIGTELLPDSTVDLYGKVVK